MKLPLQLLDPPAVLPSFHCAGRTWLAEAGNRIPLPGIQLRRIQPLFAAPGTARRLIHRSCDDHRLQSRRCGPARAASARSIGQKASARQRSNVATLIPTSRDTKSIAELSGCNSRATIRSLYACPYRATVCYPRPQRFRSYLGGNFSDTEGPHLTSGPLRDFPGLSVRFHTNRG